MSLLQLVCALLCFAPFVVSLQLADYIKPCSKSDPKLNECAKNSAIAAIPTILKGDKRYNTPVLDPLHLPEINLEASDKLQINLKNVILTGLENIKLKDIQLDLPNKKVKVSVFTNYINIFGDYNIDGQILVLPIKGNGPANLTFSDSSFVYEMKYDLVKKDDGKEYVSNITPSITYQIGKAHFNLENLFNGDKQLGDHMNKFLNENEQQIAKDLAPSVQEVISRIVTSILDGFLTKVPFEDIFLP
ncbi:protein takeout [Aethina tumida]|uniref:protein takeout n=1 Tax=Aethina tumida TaxID=116153 RepID=UPI00096AF70F|nr:protein takeout [Aethina tumida]